MAMNNYTDENYKDMLKASTLGGTVPYASPMATAGADMGKGNDMTLTKRMNAGAESMAAMNRASQSTPTGTLQPQAPSYDLFSRPGDSFGDSRKRELEYRSLLNQAADTSSFGPKRSQRSALVAAAKGMLEPGLAQVEAQNKDYQTLLENYGKNQNAMLQLGMLGKDENANPFWNSFMAGLSQIYGGNQNQPGTMGSTTQPTTTTPAPTSVTPTTAVTPSSVTNPPATGTTPTTGPQLTSALPGPKSFTDEYNNATNIYRNMNSIYGLG